MKTIIQIGILLFVLVSCNKRRETTSLTTQKDQNYLVIAKPGWDNNKISADWRDALTTRQSKHYLDSLSQVKRPLSQEEKEWFELIHSRTQQWAIIRDSLHVPFKDITLNDTINVLLGYQGSDDGFTYQYQTVCFDLTALHREYGSAKDSINTNRIDRLFAHEYTHLISKQWAKRNELILTNYKDSILWECVYEGMGMYRSMSSKWFPIDGSLSEVSSNTFDTLYPVFAERLIAIDTSKNLSELDKINLHKNLSRGSMKQKWGALPIGVWLALEANGDDRKLIPWIEMGPDAVIPLGNKYLTGESKIKFIKVFEEVPISTPSKNQ